MYKKRLIEQLVIKSFKTFPVVMLTGSRQAGKTTVLRKLAPTRRFVTLDDIETRKLATDDPKGFIDRFPPPVFIDEFQYAPELLSYIKIAVDEKRTSLVGANGDYWLSGSQNFKMMEHVCESLAGRVAILQLLGFSHSEIDGSEDTFTHDPSFDVTNLKFESKKGVDEIFKYIIRGDKPDLWTNLELDNTIYYSSYIQTYLERDVRSQIGVRDLGLFEKFMRLLAVRSGSLLNMAGLGSDVGVSLPTIQRWLTVLERSYQIYLLRPYYGGHTKRYVKTPKVYFLDTGLLSYFLKIFDVSTAVASPMNGMLFETWVISEIIKSRWHRGLDANLLFFRTKDGDEIDIIYETAKGSIASEVKLSSSPAANAIFSKVEKIKMSAKKIICTAKQNIPLGNGVEIVSAMSIY